MRLLIKTAPRNCLIGIRYQEGERLEYNDLPSTELFNPEFAYLTDRNAQEAVEEGFRVKRYYAIDVWLVLPGIEIGLANLNRRG